MRGFANNNTPMMIAAMPSIYTTHQGTTRSSEVMVASVIVHSPSLLYFLEKIFQILLRTTLKYSEI